jgi:hypothetical protein
MKGKQALRYIRSFEIIQSISLVAYKLVLPPYLDKIHDVFHVSFLRKTKIDPT